MLAPPLIPVSAFKRVDVAVIITNAAASSNAFLRVRVFIFLLPFSDRNSIVAIFLSLYRRGLGAGILPFQSQNRPTCPVLRSAIQNFTPSLHTPHGVESKPRKFVC